MLSVSLPIISEGQKRVPQCSSECQGVILLLPFEMSNMKHSSLNYCMNSTDCRV
jgi:hypothetical protein